MYDRYDNNNRVSTRLFSSVLFKKNAANRILTSFRITR